MTSFRPEELSGGCRFRQAAADQGYESDRFRRQALRKVGADGSDQRRPVPIASNPPTHVCRRDRNWSSSDFLQQDPKHLPHRHTLREADALIRIHAIPGRGWVVIGRLMSKA